MYKIWQVKVKEAPLVVRALGTIWKAVGKFGWATRVTRLTRNSVAVCDIALELTRSTMLQCRVDLVNLPVLYGFWY